MNAPEMHAARTVAPDTELLPAWMPIPGMGVLPINAYLIRAAEPVLIDTGLAALGEAFLEQLEQTIDPADLRWIWLTHTDPDHVGNLRAVLDRAPQAKVVTTYLGMGKLGMINPVPPERVYLLNPGQELEVGDRRLTALRPPTFDAPETTALLDSRSGALFSSDCFGALTAEAHELAGDIRASELREGLITWATVDAPWLHSTEAAELDRALAAIGHLAPSRVLGSHLPPAAGMIGVLLEHLRAAREARPFVGPDQQALMQMLGAAA